VLDVVVERSFHVRDIAQGKCHQADPVIVKVRELRRRKRERVLQQSAREQGRGSGHRIRAQERKKIGMVIAAAVPPRPRNQLTLPVNYASVAVDELRITQPGEQALEFVGMPGVILVGQGNELGVRGSQRQGSLEITVEAQPLGRP